MTTHLDQPRTIRSWASYDIANSAFVTVVVTALGGPYLTALANSAGSLPLGINPDSLWAYTTSLSVALQVFILPLLGAMADRRDRRTALMGLTVLGAGASFAFALSPTWLLAAVAILVANLAFGGALTVYNSFLSEISAARNHHAVSAKGFAWGYIGGGAVLAVALGLVLGGSHLGIDKGTAAQYGMILASTCWLVVGLWAAKGLPKTTPSLEKTHPVKEVVSTLKEIRRLPHTLRYLLAFLLFNDAIQAVVSLSAVYLTYELFTSQGRPAAEATSFVMGLVLLIQVVAYVGAKVASPLAGLLGAKRVLLGTIGVWIGAVAYAALVLHTQAEAWGLGVVIALVLGGSQSLARSLYSQMIPAGREAAFFSLYEVSERGTAWIGPLVFGLVLQATGSYRGAIGSLVVLLLVGGVVLLLTNTDKAIDMAGNKVTLDGPEELNWTPASKSGRMHRNVTRFARTILRLTTKTTRTGGKLPAGPMIVAGNHVSVADPLVILSNLNRPARFMCTAGLYEAPIVNTILKNMGFIPVYRHGKNPASALRPALQALEAGEVVALYPEGRISTRDDHGVGPVKTGIVRLALQSNAPIVPVVQWGTHNLVGHDKRWKSLKRFIQPTAIHVEVGEPLHLRELLSITGEPTREDLQRGAQLVEDALRETQERLATSKQSHRSRRLQLV